MGALTTKIRARLSTRTIYGIALLIILGISLALRISLPYENVFMGDWVRFGGADPWLHMRLVENLVQHFPHQIAFDPYALYPDGQIVSVSPFFDLLLGLVIWVIGLGSPSQHIIEIVGAYFPAILGALVTIPVYFIGRELFNRTMGLLSAGLIAVLPGQFLHRSILGYTDHHVAEVLFSTMAALFLIMAIKRATERETSFSHIRSRDRRDLRKPLIYALLAGLALGMYLLSWSGGVLFVFIIFVYMIIQYIIDHLRGRSTDYLSIIGVTMFLIAIIMVIPFLNSLYTKELVIASLTIGILSFIGLSITSKLMAHRNIKRVYYPLVLTGLGFLGVLIFYAVAPSMLNSILGSFNLFKPSAVQQNIGEISSLLSLSGLVGLLKAFTTDIILAFIALGLIIYAEIKERGSSRTLTFLIVWSFIMLVAMLGQNRFAYYFAVNVALLAGYLCWKILEWSWSNFKEAMLKREDGKSIVTLRKETFRYVRGQLNTVYVRVAGIAIIVLLVAFVPNVAMARIAAKDTGGPNEAWYSSLIWMREHTPEPFEDPDFYYELYDRPPAGERYDYPESAYGVMSWWHRGYWITRIAHRIPNTNPGDIGYPLGSAAGAEEAARFFLAQDESSANEVLTELGSKYVIIDFTLSTEEFERMANWDGASTSQFREIYYQKTPEGVLVPKVFYYPEYYRSMCSRLYNFGCEAVVPHNSTLVISYDEIRLWGKHYKEITSTQSFATYEEAQEYLESQTTPNFRIVSDDPFISPVPLEKLEHYKMIHQTEQTTVSWLDLPVHYVKIFEYLP